MKAQSLWAVGLNCDTLWLALSMLAALPTKAAANATRVPLLGQARVMRAAARCTPIHVVASTFCRGPDQESVFWASQHAFDHFDFQRRGCALWQVPATSLLC